MKLAVTPLLFALFLATPLSLGWSKPALAEIDPKVRLGYQALLEGRLEAAREAYLAALQRDPTERDALLGLVYTHNRLGDGAAARQRLEQLRHFYPDDSETLSATYLLEGGDPRTQAPRFEQQLERADRPAALHYALGVMYFEQGLFDEATQAFERAFFMAREQPDYAFNYALALDRVGRSQDAARLYAWALKATDTIPAAFSREGARARLQVLQPSGSGEGAPSGSFAPSHR